MDFIPFIIVLNVSIILMMMVVFSNITFVIQIQTLQVYQLADFKNLNYDEYLKRKIISNYEKKLNVDQYFEAMHNLKFMEFQLSDENDFSKHNSNLHNYCTNHYKSPKYAVQQYKVTKFHTTILELVKCATNKHPEDPTTVNIENSSENIFSVVKKALQNTTNMDSDTSISCFSMSISYMNIQKKQIKAIDTALLKLAEKLKPQANQYYIRQFYKCFQKFKNDVFNIKFENAKYPTRTTNINIDADKILTEKEKCGILEKRDIEFLKENSIYEVDNTKIGIEKSNALLTEYTDLYMEPYDYNQVYLQCRSSLIYENGKKGEWVYKFTKLSYQYFFPSQSDSLDFYNKKRLNIMKTLNNLVSRNESMMNIIQIFGNYDHVGDHYLKMMKKCRALNEERNYVIYVMRLIKNGCRPLPKIEWNEEMNIAKLSNIVAEEELRFRP